MIDFFEWMTLSVFSFIPKLFLINAVPFFLAAWKLRDIAKKDNGNAIGPWIGSKFRLLISIIRFLFRFWFRNTLNFEKFRKSNGIIPFEIKLRTKLGITVQKMSNTSDPLEYQNFRGSPPKNFKKIKGSFSPFLPIEQY